MGAGDRGAAQGLGPAHPLPAGAGTHPRAPCRPETLLRADSCAPGSHLAPPAASGQPQAPALAARRVTSLVTLCSAAVTRPLQMRRTQSSQRFPEWRHLTPPPAAPLRYARCHLLARESARPGRWTVPSPGLCVPKPRLLWGWGWPFLCGSWAWCRPQGRGGGGSSSSGGARPPLGHLLGLPDPCMAAQAADVGSTPQPALPHPASRWGPPSPFTALQLPTAPHQAPQLGPQPLEPLSCPS